MMVCWSVCSLVHHAFTFLVLIQDPPSGLLTHYPFPLSRDGASENKARYTANKQSLAGGQGQYTEGQSISGQGLYFGRAGAVMPRNHKYGQFHGIRNFALRTNQPRDTPSYIVS